MLSSSLTLLLLVPRLLLALSAGLLLIPDSLLLLLALGRLALDLGYLSRKHTGALVDNFDGDREVLLPDDRILVLWITLVRIGPESDRLNENLSSQTRLTMREAAEDTDRVKDLGVQDVGGDLEPVWLHMSRKEILESHAPAMLDELLGVG